MSTCEHSVVLIVSVRGLAPQFVYEVEIKWSLESDKLVHTWRSVVKTETDSYTFREPLVQRNDDFLFGMMAWETYKNGNDRFFIEVTVCDMHPGLTTKEALVGIRNIDSSVNTVQLKCVEQKSPGNEDIFPSHLTQFVLQSDEDAPPTGQHGFDHPAIFINSPELECECKDSHNAATSAGREQDDAASSIKTRACREGGEASWIVLVHGLVAGFVYEIHFSWAVVGQESGHHWKTNFTTSTGSYTARHRHPHQRVQKIHYFKPLQTIQKTYDFKIDASGWDAHIPQKEPFSVEVTVHDIHPGLTSEEALIGVRNINSAVNTVRVHCIDLESGEQTKMPDGGANQWEYGQWVRNVTQAQHDTASFYHEAAENVGRFNRYGWNAWSYDETPRKTLGIKAYLLCHIEQRCASAHRMIYAAGFDQVSMAQTHEIEEINLESWVATGKVSSHFNKGNTMEQRLRYVAAAVDHRNIIEMALRQNYSWVAVFEDDILLTTSPSIASTRILGALASLPREADTLHLEYCYDACKMSLYSENNQWASTAYEPYCSAAIIFSAQGIRKLLGSLDTILTAHDDHIAMRCKTKYLNCFKLRHPVYAQDMYWDSTSVSVRPQTCLGCKTMLRSKQHTLHPNIPLCRESEFGLDFVNHQIHSGEDVAFDNKTPFRELEGRQTQHPEDQLASIRIKLLKEDVSSSLMVNISGLKDTCMYFLEIFVVVYGDQEHIPVLKESRVVVVETGQTGIAFDIGLSGSKMSGVENASKNCKYAFHGTVYDTFPGLSADESVVAVVHVAKSPK